MHAFTPNGKHLLLTDAYGLTRVTLPTKSKTQRDAAGAWLCAGDARVIAHTGRWDRVEIFDAVTLKEAKISFASTFRGALHPDDAHVVTAEDDRDQPLHVKALDGLTVQRPAITGAQGAARVVLGPARTTPGAAPPLIVIGPDCALALLDPGRGRLIVGALPSAAGPLEDLRLHPLDAPPAFITIRPRRQDTFLCAYHPKERRAYCALLDSSGSVRTRVVTCLGQVAFDGARIVYQPDERAVVREPFEGGAAETFALPEGAGTGEVMAEGAVACFVPQDRTRVLNLTAKKEAARKPPGPAVEVHAFISSILSRLAPACAECGQTVSLAHITAPDRYGRCRPTLVWDVGDHGLLPFLVIGNLIQTLWHAEGGRYMVGSYHNIDTLRPVDTAELTHTLLVLEENGLSLIRGLNYLTTAFERCYRRHAGDGPDLPVRPLMDRDAAHLFLWAVMESIRAGRDIPLAAAAPELARRPLFPDIVLEHILPGAGSDEWVREGSGQTALAYVVLFYFGEEALPIFIDWLLTRPSNFARANAHILAVPAARLAQMSPAARDALLAACDKVAACGDPARAQQGSSVRSALELNIR